MAIHSLPAPPGAGGLSRIIWAEDMGCPLPPRRWVSEALTISAGRPTVLAGVGGSRKGWLAMAAMLSAATGEPLLGRFGFARCRSLYCDWEQTERVTIERFQLLAGAAKLDLAKLGKTFGYLWRPLANLGKGNLERAASELARLVDGFGFAVVDSARASSGGAKENSEEASVPFDLLTSVSEATGCAFVLIDHASAKQDDGASQRGHTSKLDASQTLFLLRRGADSLVTEVRCTRSQGAAEERWPKPFGFRLEATAGGVRLVDVDVDDGGGDDGGGVGYGELTVKIVDHIRLHPGCSGNDVCAAVTARRSLSRAAIQSLEASGGIIRQGFRLYARP